MIERTVTYDSSFSGGGVNKDAWGYCMRVVSVVYLYL